MAQSLLLHWLADSVQVPDMPMANQGYQRSPLLASLVTQNQALSGVHFM